MALRRTHARTVGPTSDPDGTRDRRAMDRLFGIYLLVAGAALAFSGRPGSWPLLALLHLAGAATAFNLPPFSRAAEALGSAAPRVANLVHDWYPLALIPLLYKELVTLNLAVWGGRYFDGLIVQAERAIFGGQPSVSLARSFPYLAVSEPLHAAYLSYYLIIYLPPILLYAAGRVGDFRRLVFPLMLTFFVHYLFFVYFPVQGPRYIYPPPGGELANGPVYRLAHHLLESGSSRGAAFPSSHVAVSVTQTLMVFRLMPRLGPIIAVLAGGLTLGAVYAGFHYGTDALAGLLLGVALVLAAPSVRRLLGPPAFRR